MQLALYEAGGAGKAGKTGNAGHAGKAGKAVEPREAGAARRAGAARTAGAARRMCAACQAREARYGFRDAGNGDPGADRPKTLCFDCFRMEMDRRRMVAAQLARGWNATQTALPLAGTLEALSRRRRRAQIAARHALGLR